MKNLIKNFLNFSLSSILRVTQYFCIFLVVFGLFLFMILLNQDFESVEWFFNLLIEPSLLIFWAILFFVFFVLPMIFNEISLTFFKRDQKAIMKIIENIDWDDENEIKLRINQIEEYLEETPFDLLKEFALECKVDLSCNMFVMKSTGLLFSQMSNSASFLSKNFAQ